MHVAARIRASIARVEDQAIGRGVLGDADRFPRLRWCSVRPLASGENESCRRRSASDRPSARRRPVDVETPPLGVRVVFAFGMLFAITSICRRSAESLDALTRCCRTSRPLLICSLDRFVEAAVLRLQQLRHGLLVGGVDESLYSRDVDAPPSGRIFIVRRSVVAGRTAPARSPGRRELAIVADTQLTELRRAVAGSGRFL